MAKNKRRYNAKARKTNLNCKPESPQKEQLMREQGSDKAGDKNVLLVEEDAEYSTVLKPNPQIVDIAKKGKSIKEVKGNKVLSKKKRKHLDKILEKKKKKAKRSDLLKSLSEYQVSEKELSLYHCASKLGQANSKAHQIDSVVNSEVGTGKISIGRKRGRKIKQIQKLSKPAPAKKENENGNFSEDEEDLHDSEEAETSTDENDTDADNFNVIQDKKDAYSSVEEQPYTTTVNLPDSELNREMPKESESTEKKADDIKCRQEKNNPAIFVELKRTHEIQAARVLLPILAEEQLIMETIKENDVVVLSGETGSGKTTQVPQFLYEAGYSSHNEHSGIIGVTEPRRVAAVSMSKRVATEMNLDSSMISYQIRYEGNVKDTTKVKFMTDGVLLKEMETDFLLMKYCVIIIDEAHERSVFTDILIGLLSRIVPLRKKKAVPLKLIIMSATLRLEDFVESKQLFPKSPPVLKIDSRQYPVTVHFNKKTHDDYVTEAYKKVCKIHRTLKSGGILVFLTGQNEVHALCRKLRRTFSAAEKSKQKIQDSKEKRFKQEKIVPKFSLDSYPDVPANDGYDEEIDLYDQNEDTNHAGEDYDSDDEAYDEFIDSELPLHVLPLYSLLSSEKQAKVFEPCPEGSRLCVVSTNVAETSLTIPGIKYVVDSGKVKTKCYDKLTGVSSFRITWTSKASANQRAGRAGRLEPGHCYRLYSSAVFQHELDDYSLPEILRRPADELLLLMKNIGIDRVTNFPFPTPPNADTLQAAENHLLDLKALEKKKTRKGGWNTMVTVLGKTMGKLPVAPRYAKMILMAHQENCMQYMITIIAALTVKEIFTDNVKIDEDAIKNDELTMAKKRSLITQARRKWAGVGESSLLGDMMVILRAVGACEFAGCTEKFCKENGLRYKAMVEIRKLRAQLSKAVNGLNKSIDAFTDFKITPPSEAQTKVIRQILLSCLGDKVARKIPPSDIKDVSSKNAYQSCSTEDPVFIHPASAMFEKLPEYVVYQEIVETSKLYMKGVTAIEEEWLAMFAPYKCTFSKPLETHKPFYDMKTGKMKCYMTSSYGPHSWSLPAQELDFPESTEKYKWFAMAFLEGKVTEALEEYVPYLLAPASVMTKTWAKLHARTEVLLRALISAGVSDKANLIRIWKEKKEFLLKAYLQWMPESLHAKISQNWPPMR